MKNSALILTVIAVAAIVFVVWYLFIRAPKYTSWRTFSQPYRERAFAYPCSHGTVYYTSADVNNPNYQTSGTFDINKLCATKAKRS